MREVVCGKWFVFARRGNRSVLPSCSQKFFQNLQKQEEGYSTEHVHISEGLWHKQVFFVGYYLGKVLSNLIHCCRSSELCQIHSATVSTSRESLFSAAAAAISCSFTGGVCVTCRWMLINLQVTDMRLTMWRGKLLCISLLNRETLWSNVLSLGAMNSRFQFTVSLDSSLKPPFVRL